MKKENYYEDYWLVKGIKSCKSLRNTVYVNVESSYYLYNEEGSARKKFRRFSREAGIEILLEPTGYIQLVDSFFQGGAGQSWLVASHVFGCSTCFWHAGLSALPCPPMTRTNIVQEAKEECSPSPAVVLQIPTKEDYGDEVTPWVTDSQ